MSIRSTIFISASFMLLFLSGLDALDTFSNDNYSQILKSINENDEINLLFTIDEAYFIAHTLVEVETRRFSSDEYIDDLLAFRDHMAQVAEVEMQALLKHCLVDEIDYYRRVYFAHPDWLEFPEMEFLINEAKRSSEYQRILAQTDGYLDFCKEQWFANYEVSSELVKNLTGFPLQRTIKVYITHPGLLNGRCLGNREIAWGNSERFPNYSTVYLWHEILHTYFEYDDLSHSLIQFIADNELRVHLNGGTYPPYIGHPCLFEMMELIQPYWMEYLQSDKKGDILKFYEQIKENLELEERSKKIRDLKVTRHSNHQ